MKISNNYSPAFKALYAQSDAFERLAYLTQNRRTSEDCKKAYESLKNASKGTDVLLVRMDDGLAVEELEDFRTKKTKRLITKNEDFIKGMQIAAEILGKESQPPKAPRKRFEGKLDING